MLTKIARAVAIAAVAGSLLAGTAFAASNPSPTGTGQPTQSCQAVFPLGPLSPAGFNTAGFAHAVTVYAGSGASLVSGNLKAVSQYDVACYQVSHH
jgi:hypothetical protein